MWNIPHIRQSKTPFSYKREKISSCILETALLKTDPLSNGMTKNIVILLAEKQKTLIISFLPFVKLGKYKNHLNFPKSWQLFRGKVICKDFYIAKFGTFSGL